MGLTKKQVSEIRLRTQKGERGCDLAIEFDVSKSLISQIKNRKKCVKQVWLTIEEARELMKLLDLCEYWLANNNVSYDCDAWASLLEERIIQAEKQ